MLTTLQLCHGLYYVTNMSVLEYEEGTTLAEFYGVVTMGVT